MLLGMYKLIDDLHTGTPLASDFEFTTFGDPLDTDNIFDAFFKDTKLLPTISRVSISSSEYKRLREYFSKFIRI